MLFWTTIKVGLKSLWGNKLRSILAMLGIIIGVAAVIAMLAMGTGTRKRILSRVSAMGTRLLVIRPGQAATGGRTTGSMETLTLSDALALVNQAEGVASVAPVVQGSFQLKYMGKNTRSQVTGTSISYLPIRDFQVERGSVFTEAQVDQKMRVVILGPTTAENLFGITEPLGQVIKINGLNFTVIGIFKAKGDQGWANPDDQAIIPYTTGMKLLFGKTGVTHRDSLREIDVEVQESADQSAVLKNVEALLRKRHKLAEGADSDFTVRNQADMVAMGNDFGNMLSFLLGGIASVSLLVGGIGIMNIMLVSVTERTREIGIRKAIGAKERTVLLQFLLEAVIVSGLGGLIGVALGTLASKFVAYLSSTIPTMAMFAVEQATWHTILAIGFSAMVGIFFGFYPAFRAARMDPVEALRYE